MFGIGKFFRRDDKAKVEEQEAPRTEADAPAGSEDAAPYEPDRAAEADFVPEPDTLLDDAPAAEPEILAEQGAAPDSAIPGVQSPSAPASPATSTVPPAAPGPASPVPAGGAAAPSAAASRAAAETPVASPVAPSLAPSPTPAAAPQPASPVTPAAPAAPDTAPAVPQAQTAAPENAQAAPRPAEGAAAADAQPASTTAPAASPPSLATSSGLFTAPTSASESAAAAPPAPVEPAAAPQPLTAPRPSEATRDLAPENGGFFSRLKAGLSKTRDNLAEGLSALVLGRKTIDEDLLEDIETQLLSADLGLEATTEVLEELRRRVKRKQLADSDALLEALKQILFDLLQPTARPLELPPPGGEPFVILMVGVNGVGKTTTIGKLAKRYQQEGHDVLLAAGDTFRAAAVEQLQAWGEHNGVPVIAQHTGADSASVIFDAYQAARARGADVLIADTAGRLHTKSNLMQELEKVLRVLRKLEPSLPQEVLLVLDATTGQNALSQAKHFTEAVQVSGLVITKLDGSAKGGMVFAIAKQLDLPIRYIGIGERADDLRPFDARQFVDALFATR